jgi:integration host factor subunit beta
MTKADLIAVVAEKLKFPWGRAEVVVDQIFDSMVEALKRGEGIEIRGFGSFTIREYKAYEGRNPRTGETVHVRPKRLAFFKVGKELRERVNQGQAASSGNGTSTNGVAPPVAVAAAAAELSALPAIVDGT